MGNLRMQGGIGVDNGKYTLDLHLISFKEDKNNIIYSPALDLVGYGKTQRDAMESFIEVVNEFIRYTHNKKTLRKVFADLGWVVKGGSKKPRFTPPANTEIAKNNELFTEILNNKNYRTFNQTLQLAI